MVIAAAEAGARGIFCEKPLAASLGEADAMMAACAFRNVKVAVAHRRANPYEQYGKKLVDEGAIGQLQVLRARGKWDRRHGAEDLAVLGEIRSAIRSGLGSAKIPPAELDIPEVRPHPSVACADVRWSRLTEVLCWIGRSS